MYYQEETNQSLYQNKDANSNVAFIALIIAFAITMFINTFIGLIPAIVGIIYAKKNNQNLYLAGNISIIAFTVIYVAITLMSA